MNKRSGCSSDAGRVFPRGQRHWLLCGSEAARSLTAGSSASGSYGQVWREHQLRLLMTYPNCRPEARVGCVKDTVCMHLQGDWKTDGNALVDFQGARNSTVISPTPWGHSFRCFSCIASLQTHMRSWTRVLHHRGRALRAAVPVVAQGPTQSSGCRVPVLSARSHVCPMGAAMSAPPSTSPAAPLVCS